MVNFETYKFVNTEELLNELKTVPELDFAAQTDWP